MKFDSVYIDQLNNNGSVAGFYGKRSIWQLGPGAKIIRSYIGGPLYLNRNSQVGPSVVAGKYLSLNADCYIARSIIGSYCSIGARTSINPFNHPTHWLSCHEFQYHPDSFNWVEEYNDVVKIERPMTKTCVVGSDVWMGHHVHVMNGAEVGDGAVIAAGSVVTKDVPPYAIVAGTPATVKRLRFNEKTVERLLKLRWWDMELGAMSGLPFDDIERCLDMLEERKSVGIKKSA